MQQLVRRLNRPSSLLARSFSSGSPKAKPEVFEPVVAPGPAPSDRIADMYEQSAGLERLEYLANLAKRPIFLMDQLKVDHFGTLQDPIIVPSIEGQRMVGCSGFPAESHQLLWFNVNSKQTCRCPECGQAFAVELVNQHVH